MTETLDPVQKIFQQLKPEGFDIVEAVRMPANQQDLNSALAQFDQENAIPYLIKVRPQKVPDISPQQSIAADIYQADGKLNVQFLLKNAELLFDSGEADLALNIYGLILKNQEGNAVALFGMGRCFEKKSKLTEAEASYRESIAYDPQLRTFKSLISLYIKQKDNRKAAELIERALLLNDLSREEKFKLHHAAGNCWMKIEEVASAERHYQDALNIDDQSPQIYSNLGSLYLQAGRIGESVKAFEGAIKLGKASSKAYLGLGCCYIAHGRKADALEAFVSALERKMDDPTAIFYLVKCAYETRRYERAEPLVRQYVDRAPLNPNLLYCLAGLQYHVGKMQEARETAQRILELRPGHVGAKELIGIIGRNS